MHMSHFGLYDITQSHTTPHVKKFIFWLGKLIEGAFKLDVRLDLSYYKKLMIKLTQQQNTYFQNY